MAETQTAWLQTLDPAKKRKIKEFHRINPYWNLVGLLFIALWCATACAMLAMPSMWVLVPGYIIIGLMIHGMANLMHEGIHGTLFRHRYWDHWYGFVMAAPSLFSITAYGVNHKLHHRHNRSKEDPDEFTNVSPNRTILSIFYYVWIVVGMFIYAVRVPFVAMTQGTTRERCWVVLEHAIVLSGISLIVYFAWQHGALVWVAHLWLLPLAFAAMLGNVRGWAEHTRTSPGHPLTETRTITSTRLFSFFNINLNYHLEHHLFPGIPWYNLPKVHATLLEDYEAAGASIYGSYSAFLWDAFRWGLFGGPKRTSPKPLQSAT